MAATYVGTVDRIGELVAIERRAIEALAVHEADLANQLERVRQQRLIADARIDAILATARLLEVPEPSRPRPAPPRYEGGAADDTADT